MYPQDMSHYALSAQRVTKVYPILDSGQAWRLLLGDIQDGPSVTALKDLTLDVPKGKFVGIIGRNGAGKSTLLRVLGKTYTPTSGVVKVNGDLVGLFELGGVADPRLTGRDYATRILSLLGADEPKELNDLLTEVHEFSELGEAFSKPVYTYSSGMGARLYFSIITAKQHEVYLIDEALSVGDAHFQAKCWDRIKARLTTGASGILVTHDWSAVLKLCTECHIVDRGSIVKSGPTEEVVRAYLGLSQTSLDEGAKFLEPAARRVHGRPGEDLEIKFRLKKDPQLPIAFRYSVEFMRPGYGWEILLLSNDLSISSNGSEVELSLKISKLPLNAGLYYLNVFLVSPQETNKIARCYDARAWTFGNNFELEVTGPTSSSILRMPMKASIEEFS